MAQVLAALLHALAEGFQFGLAESMCLGEHLSFSLARVMLDRRGEHRDLDVEVLADGVGAKDDGELVVYLSVLGMGDREQWADVADRRVEQVVLGVDVDVEDAEQLIQKLVRCSA